MKLEIGKQYIRRDGVITHPLIDTPLTNAHAKSHPFYDPSTGVSYAYYGSFYHEGCEDHKDIVDEYPEQAEASEPAASDLESRISNPAPPPFDVYDSDKLVQLAVDAAIAYPLAMSVVNDDKIVSITRDGDSYFIETDVCKYWIQSETGNLFTHHKP